MILKWCIGIPHLFPHWFSGPMCLVWQDCTLPFFPPTSNKISAEQVWPLPPSLYWDGSLLSMASHRYSELKPSTRKSALNGVKSIAWSSHITLEAAGMGWMLVKVYASADVNSNEDDQHGNITKKLTRAAVPCYWGCTKKTICKTKEFILQENFHWSQGTEMLERLFGIWQGLLQIMKHLNTCV